MITQVLLIAAIAAAVNAGVLLGGVGLGGIDGGIGLEGGLGLRGLGGGLIGGGERVVDLYAPPRYEFKYAVADPKTGDLKERAETRINELVKQEYSWAEPDRTIRVAKVDDGVRWG